MLLATSLAALLLCGSTSCSPMIENKRTYAVKETHFVPRGWKNNGIPNSDHLLDLKIGISNNRFAELERHLYEVSNPKHSRYGQHFTKDQISDLTRPSQDASMAVDEWLRDHNIESWQCNYSQAGDWISIALPVSKVESMLDTTFSVYQHEDGTSMIRTTQWSLPQHLHEYISTIQPTTAFMRASPKAQTVLQSPGEVELPEIMDFAGDFPPSQPTLNGICNFGGMSPACLRTLYGTVNYKPQSPNSTIAFTNYLGEIPNRNDTAKFLSMFRRDAVPGAADYQQISINGGVIDNGTAQAGYEGDLDIQTILGQVYPMNVTSYSTGGAPPFQPDLNSPINTNEPYLTWLTYTQGLDTLPQTISTSYGDDEQTVPLSYARAVCEGFAQLGLRGVSIIFSSGDNGVGANGTCISNDGKNTTQFIPAFPASCPYITAVGGTRSHPEVVAYNPANGYASGAGFSNYFPQPAYQSYYGVVNDYVRSLNGSFDGLYNRSGRAYPDVSAQGYRYLSIHSGVPTSLDGTSASAPTVASVVALVNDALMAAGRSPLGFLNPWLYSGAGAEAFTDVVNGSSIGCNSAGFPAQKGWDAASGWGTPQFPTMLEILNLNATGL